MTDAQAPSASGSRMRCGCGPSNRDKRGTGVPRMIAALAQRRRQRARRRQAPASAASRRRRGFRAAHSRPPSRSGRRRRGHWPSPPATAIGGGCRHGRPAKAAAENDQREEQRRPPPASARADGWTPARPRRISARRVGIVEQAPMAADGAFQRALPGLVEGLDHVDAEVLALGHAPARPGSRAPGWPATAARPRACGRRSASRPRRSRSPCRESAATTLRGSHRHGRRRRAPATG